MHRATRIVEKRMCAPRLSPAPSTAAHRPTSSTRLRCGGVTSDETPRATPRWVKPYRAVVAVVLIGGMFGLSVAVGGLWLSLVLFGLFALAFFGTIRFALNRAKARNVDHEPPR